MEYESLIAEFGARYGMKDLAPDEDGAVGIEVDGRTLVLQRQAGTDVVIVTLDLGQMPTGGEMIMKRLLLLNLALFVQDGMMIGLAENGYRLFYRFDIAKFDFTDFDERIARLLDRADQWGGLLEQIGTLAAAPGASDAGAASAGSFSPPGLEATLGLLRV